MRNGFLTSLTALILTAGSGWGQDTLPPASNAEPAAREAPVLTSPTPAPAAAAPMAPIPAVPAIGACDPGCATAMLCDCPPACPCPERFWASAEFLLWWTKGSPLPPLLTTGPPVPLPGCPGALGQPGTVVLFGGRDANTGVTPGGRFAAGLWLDDCRRWGIEGSYFFLGRQSDDFFATSPGTPILARPFTDPLLGPCAELLAFPAGLFPAAIGGAAGTFAGSLSTRFHGFDANVVRNLRDGCNGRLDLLVGFRYLNLRERLEVREDLVTGAGTTALANSTITVVDRIATENDFYGGQIGARGEVWRGRFFVRGIGKVALGTTRQEVIIDGATQITGPDGVVVTQPGGLLALPTNIGRYSRDRFSVVPEGTVHVGYQVTDAVRAFVSYTFLYWSDVVRPGDQIDPVINPAFAPTNLDPTRTTVPARPAFTFRETDFWAQGVGFGIEVRY